MLTRDKLEERLERGTKNLKGEEPILGSSTQYAEFILEKIKSPKIGLVQYNVRQMRFMVGNQCVADFQRNDKSKNKVNQKTVVAIRNHVNHFLSWLQLTDRESDLNHFIMLVTDMDRTLSRDNINRICNMKLEEIDVFNEKKTFRDNEKEFFIKTIMDRVVSDTRLMQIVNDYTYDITLYNNKDDKDVDKKLESIDMHVLHVLSFYTKILFIFYYRIGGVGTWISVIKEVLIALGNNANEMALCTNFSDADRTTFLDRLYSFLEFSMKKEIYDNQRNIQKFSCVGFNDTSLLSMVVDEVLSLLYRMNILEYENNTVENLVEDNPNDTLAGVYMYENIADFCKTGLVDSNTAGYIHAAKKKIVSHKIGKFNPDYIIRSYDITSDSDDETPESAKFEIYLEKVNKEWGEKYDEIYVSIMEGVKNDLFNTGAKELNDTNKQFVSNVFASGLKRTTFNRFMVSIYLETHHGCDVSPLLTDEDFIHIIVKIWSILVYPNMKIGIFGDTQGRNNVSTISEDEIDSYYLMANSAKVIRTLDEMVRYTYATTMVTEDSVKVSNNVDIRDELLEFLNNGCEFSARGKFDV